MFAVHLKAGMNTHTHIHTQLHTYHHTDMRACRHIQVHAHALLTHLQLQDSLHIMGAGGSSFLEGLEAFVSSLGSIPDQRTIMLKHIKAWILACRTEEKPML